MPERVHDLTPVAPRMPALIGAGLTVCFVAVLCSTIFIQIWPPTFWDRLEEVARSADFASLGLLYDEAYSKAYPPALFFYGNEDMFTRMAAVAHHYYDEIAFTWNFPATLFDTVADRDLLASFLIRLGGILATSLSAAWPVYRHLRFRTPMVRRAQWVDGPEVIWFRAAIRQAKTSLGALAQQFPNGIELAPGLHVPKKAEFESSFLIGLPGSGKSVILEGIARQAIDGDHHVLCLDVKGSLRDRIASLVGNERCTALGLGRHCGVWDIGIDAQDPRTMSRIASTLIPQSRDPVWSAASRLVLRGLMQDLSRRHHQEWGWQHLQTEISQPVEAICAKLAPTMAQVAQLLRSHGDDPTTMSLSVVFNMIAHVSDLVDNCAALEAEGRPALSLKAWTQKKKDQARVIVLEHDLSDRENSELLLTVLLRSVASELLSSKIPDSVDHNFWIFADELPRIKAAAADIAELGALGRSRGIRVVGSAQSFAQLEGALTRPGADALMENFGVVIVCKTRPGRNADEIAESLIGKSTYAFDKSAETGQSQLFTAPALSPIQMSRCLGLTIDWRGRNFVRAAIVGFDDIYVVEWPLDDWQRF